MKTALLFAMVCVQATANAVTFPCCPAPCSTRAPRTRGCFAGTRRYDIDQEVRFVSGFSLWKYPCPDAVKSYNYESAKYHDPAYQHGEWWRSTCPYQAIENALMA